MKTTMELCLFCHNIRILRQHYKLSQKEMAQQLHIGIHSLRMLEKGIIPQRMGIEIFFYIYRLFGFSPNEVVSIDIRQHLL